MGVGSDAAVAASVVTGVAAAVVEAAGVAAAAVGVGFGVSWLS